MKKIDPRTGLFLFIIVVATIYGTRPSGTLWILLWLLCVIPISLARRPRFSDFIPPGIIMLAFFSLITHAFWSPAPYLVTLGALRISTFGLARGALLAVRLVLTAATARLLAGVSTPLGLASALQWVLQPLAGLGLSLPDLPMLMAIGARFVPELLTDARRLITLWRLRYSGTQRLTYRRVLTSAGRELILPLFRLSWRRATTLGEALALRHYSPARRTALPPYRPKTPDRWAWIVTLVFCLLAIR